MSAPPAGVIRQGSPRFAIASAQQVKLVLWAERYTSRGSLPAGRSLASLPLQYRCALGALLSGNEPQRALAARRRCEVRNRWIAPPTSATMRSQQRGRQPIPV
jgi:hypothetical protein